MQKEKDFIEEATKVFYDQVETYSWMGCVLSP